MSDIVLTWPKSRTLHSYHDELEKADIAGLLINYHLRSQPTGEIERCYMVHDGAVRGWNEVVSIDYKQDNEVRNPISGGFWPQGHYVVRDPHWNPIAPIEMRGFRGWRYWTQPTRR